MEETPFFSVLMCSQSIDHYFREAVESILNQSYKNFEFIIVANGDRQSLSNSFSRLGYVDPRIRFECTSIKQLAFNLNFGINLARGHYIVRMDADDIALPDRLEKLYEHCNANLVDVIGSSAAIIDTDGHEIGMLTTPLSNEKIRALLTFKNPYIHPTTAIRRDTLLKVGGYLSQSIGEDYDLWLVLARDPDIIFKNIPDSLLKYRYHPGQTKMRLSSCAYSCSLRYREFLVHPSFKKFISAFLYFFYFWMMRSLGKIRR